MSSVPWIIDLLHSAPQPASGEPRIKNLYVLAGRVTIPIRWPRLHASFGKVRRVIAFKRFRCGFLPGRFGHSWKQCFMRNRYVHMPMFDFRYDRCTKCGARK